MYYCCYRLSLPGVERDAYCTQCMWRRRGEKSPHFAPYIRALASPGFYNLRSNCYEHFSQVVGVIKPAPRAI